MVKVTAYGLLFQDAYLNHIRYGTTPPKDYVPEPPTLTSREVWIQETTVKSVVFPESSDKWKGELDKYAYVDFPDKTNIRVSTWDARRILEALGVESWEL